MPFVDTTTMTVLWAAASALWLVLAVAMIRSPFSTQRLITRGMIIGVAVLAVVLAVPHDVFSDDAFRYRWDGWVTVNGIDPYAAAPDDPQLHALGFTDAGGRHYPDVLPYGHLRTIYPPGSQWLMAGIVALTGVTDPLPFKLTWWAVVVALAIIAYRLVAPNARSWYVLALANPVVLLHGVMDMHVDVIMALLTLIGLLSAARGRGIAGAGVLGAAITVKYLPVLFVPALLRGRSVRERIVITGVLVATILLISAPFLTSSMFGSLTTFLRSWQANAGMYALMRAVLTDEQTRAVLMVLMGFGIGIVWYRHHTTPILAGVLSALVVLVVAPVVHAWYLLLPMMLLPLAPLRTTIVWGCTMCVYGVFYTTYKGDGVWFEHPVALAMEYIPVWIAFARDLQCGPLPLRDEERAHLAVRA